jgi:hypothetical protein
MKYLEYAKNRKCIRGCQWMDNELGEWGVAASRYGIFFFEVIKLFKTYIVLMFVHLYGYY